MPWLIVGTIPDDEFPLLEGPCSVVEGKLSLSGRSQAIRRGTPALMAAAALAAQTVGIEPPTALLAGDTGSGRGSELVYRRLTEILPSSSYSLLVFHYLQPDVDWHNRIFLTLQDLEDRPTLVADAGYMYVAKMSGFASSYDLFTPDIGELAFLADESAPHPFYTRGFLLKEEDRAEELIRRAYRYENAARYLLVKGKCDLVSSPDGISARICEPCVENMEPIGGTGDTLTGIASALIYGGTAISQAAAVAAKANRLLGSLGSPTPATSVNDLLTHVPEALRGSLRVANEDKGC